MPVLRLRIEAELDLLETAAWYESEQDGLGDRFLDAVRDVFMRIEETPRQFPVVTEGIRRALVRRFPFGVFFAAEASGSVVLAVMHLHREPGTWKARR